MSILFEADEKQNLKDTYHSKLSFRLNKVPQPAITCSKLTNETLEQGVNFEHISHLVLVFLLLILSG